MGELTHLGPHGRARMVDVSNKAATIRQAVARGAVIMDPATLELLAAGKMAKGDVLAVAQVPESWPKKTPELIPGHPLLLAGWTRLAIDRQPAASISRPQSAPAAPRVWTEVLTQSCRYAGPSATCKAVDKDDHHAHPPRRRPAAAASGEGQVLRE